MTWLPIVDVSRHQGAIDFRKMRAAGVAGVILRVSHGRTLDDRFARYWGAALAAGYTPGDLAVYTFVNPKRGTADECAAANIEALRTITGTTELGFMLDCEAYANEGPNIGQTPVRGAAYAAYVARYRDLMTAAGARVFGYTNASFWDWFVKDRGVAGSLEWLVPRYPIHTAAGYIRFPVPPSPSGWDEWAFARAPGPFPPAGAAGWAGWQFSADHNGQGPRYGCQSSALDLNIVDADAWARWTGPKGWIMEPCKRRLTPDPIKVPKDTDVVFQTGLHSRTALLNIDVVKPASDGWLDVWGTGPWPGTSASNFYAGKTVSNLTFTAVALGTIKLRASADCQVVIDLVAVEPGSGDS